MDISAWPDDALTPYLCALVHAREEAEFSRLVPGLVRFWDQPYYSSPATAVICDNLKSLAQRDHSALPAAFRMWSSLLSVGFESIEPAAVAGLSAEARRNRIKGVFLASERLAWLSSVEPTPAADALALRSCSEILRRYPDVIDIVSDIASPNISSLVRSASASGTPTPELADFCSIPSAARRLAADFSKSVGNASGSADSELPRLRTLLAVFPLVADTLAAAVGHPAPKGQADFDKFLIDSVPLAFRGDFRSLRDERLALLRDAISRFPSSGERPFDARAAWKPVAWNLARDLFDPDALKDLASAFSAKGYEPEDVESLPSGTFARIPATECPGADLHSEALLDLRAFEKRLGWNGGLSESAADAALAERLSASIKPRSLKSFMASLGATPMEIKKAATAACHEAKSTLSKLYFSSRCGLDEPQVADLVASFVLSGVDIRSVKDLAGRLGEPGGDIPQAAFALAEAYAIDRHLASKPASNAKPTARQNPKPKGL